MFNAIKKLGLRLIILFTVGVPFLDAVGMVFGFSDALWEWTKSNPLIVLAIVAGYLLYTWITMDRQRAINEAEYKKRLDRAPKRSKKRRK